MTLVALIRHGPTGWNEERRLQGRADRPLSAAGRARVAGWRVPDECRNFEWVSSPLKRARQTAEILELPISRLEPAIVEMDWGDWEGRTRPELDEKYGGEVAERTAMGLDLRPHNGETPREVRARVAGWMESVAAAGRPVGAICHQGIVRAALSLATGWTMIGKPPIRMDWDSLHLFRANAGEALEIVEMNVGLREP